MVHEIDAERTKEMIQGEDVVLIDVLGPQSYKEHHLPGAVNVPVKHPKFEREMQEVIPSKDATVVVYCADLDCPASPTAAKKLESLGYTNVYDFEAGLQGWEEAGFSFEGEDAERQAGDGKERDDEVRDEGDRTASKAPDRKGQEKESVDKSKKGEKKDDVNKGEEDDEVQIDDLETHMQAG